MKAKTSITLSLPLLVEIDRLIGERASRSAYIEKVLKAHLRDEVRHAAQQRDKELIDASADRLNAEMEEVLEYQDAYFFDLAPDQAIDTTPPPSLPACENRPGQEQRKTRLVS